MATRTFFGVCTLIIVACGTIGAHCANSQQSFENATEPSLPLYFKAWFFNLTNYEDFSASGDWSMFPQFEEVGPFVWREIREKYDLREGPNDTIFYKQNITYIFDPELSGPGLTEATRLNIVNVPLITVVTFLDIYPALRILATPILQSLLTSGESLFTPNVPVVEALFHGVSLKPIYRTFESSVRAMGIPMPDEWREGKFGFYLNKNATNVDGEWQVNRGLDNSSLRGTIESINGKSSLEPWWYAPCAMINGTDGTVFPFPIVKDTRLHVFSEDACRSLYLEYDQEVNYGNVTGYRFKMSKDNFADPYLEESNQCFCMDKSAPLNGSCNFNGLQRKFSCKENMPLVASKPHFLHTDEWMVAEAIRMGLSPRNEKHEFVIDLEPTTGTPLSVHHRLQTGVEIQSFLTFDYPPFDTIPHKMYPTFWVDHTSEK